MFNTVNILIIEDEPAIVELITQTLKEKPPGWPIKYNLRAISSLAEANKYAGAGGWDAIILDLGLPDSTGIATFGAIYALTETPIVVFTGNEDYDLINKIRSLGAARCYSKIWLSKCMSMMHYVIDNVIREKRKNNRLEYLQAAMFDELRNLVSECSNCHRWRDPVTERFVSPTKFLERFRIYITSGICPDCRTELYGHLDQDDE